MTDPLVLLVARPTPSGTNERALAALADAVAQRVPGPVRVAHLDQDEPTIHDVLDAALADGVPAVTIVPLALPPDAYLTTWIGRAVANWRETRGDAARVEIGLAPPLAATDPLADAVAALTGAPTTAITASPAGFRSPAWSVLEIPARHLLVCRGPRCTVYGAGATYRAAAAAARGTDTQVSPVGCLGPCNLGPLVIDNPSGEWHQRVTAERVGELAVEA